ncbi:MAG TPA: hypothetical protein VG965_05090 [Patescibacteria group bacterium]|nr:hypothetical protein [Patescibacteria group bacterium]
MKLNWFGLAIISLFSLSLMSILITYLTRRGLPVYFVLIGLGIIPAIYYISQTFIFSHTKIELNLTVLLIIIAIGILSTIGNVTIFQAANDAPNPGLALAIAAGMQSAVVAIIAFFIFRDKLNAIQILGIILGVLAVFLINIGSRVEKSVSTKQLSQARSSKHAK